jgi:hypothetical protein
MTPLPQYLNKTQLRVKTCCTNKLSQLIIGVPAAITKEYEDLIFDSTQPNLLKPNLSKF